MSSEAVADLQSARRTWWMLYSLESDLCIEYGKPLSIRERDAKAAYPLELPPVVSTNARSIFRIFLANQTHRPRLPLQMSINSSSSPPRRSSVEFPERSSTWYAINQGEGCSCKYRTVSNAADLQISDISETNRPIQSFVGRLMNHQAELMTWRGELPAHLAPRESASTKEVSSENDEAPWIQSQRCGLELREPTRFPSLTLKPEHS